MSTVMAGPLSPNVKERRPLVTDKWAPDEGRQRGGRGREHQRGGGRLSGLLLKLWARTETSRGMDGHYWTQNGIPVA